MKKNVLVFPCGSEIGLEIYRSLSFSTHFNLIGGSSVDDHGSFVYENYVGDLPRVEEEGFADAINRIVDLHSIDYIFPAHDSVVLKLAEIHDQGNLRCDLITSDFETCMIARSKSMTYETFKGILPIPDVFQSIEEIDENKYPIFIKPDVGQGSKGALKAQCREDAECVLRNNQDILFLEYLPGDEYTIDCFTNYKGELLYSSGRARKRVANGISVRSERVNDERFAEYANIINQKVSLRGAWFFQLKISASGELKLLEFAPRVAGTMGLTRCAGVNLPLMAAFDRAGVDVQVLQNDCGLVIDRGLLNRYKHNIMYDQVYIDLDDLIVFEGKVNENVIAYIFQCIGKGIKVSLLTRHNGNLADTLSKYRLTDVFDELIQITDEDEKYKFIHNYNSIFIDDSFAERKKVHDNCGVPVFDSHMIEALMPGWPIKDENE